MEKSTRDKNLQIKVDIDSRAEREPETGIYAGRATAAEAGTCVKTETGSETGTYAGRATAAEAGTCVKTETASETGTYAGTEILAKKKPLETEKEDGGWHRDICQGVLMAYFIVMALIYPLYAPGGYMRIGEVKYLFFRNVSLVTLAVLAAVLLVSVLIRRDRRWIVRNYEQMSVTDWFAYGYLTAVLLSYLCSDYKQDAFGGADGWYMGVMTQLTLVLCYFFFSRYFHWDMKWMGVWLTAAALTFLLGICNRYSVYPVFMEGQTDTFISTMGNINWFCGYWSVTAPVGMALYWCSDKAVIRILSGIYSAIAMVSGVTQGSNSAWLVFGAVFLMLFLLSACGDCGHKWYRFLELCMIFFAGCLLAKILRYVPALDYNYGLFTADGGSLTAIALLDGNAAWKGLLAVALIYVSSRWVSRQGNLSGRCGKQCKWMRRAMAGVLLTVLCTAAFLLLLDSDILQFREVPGTMERDGSLELAFNEDWGNGRGATWNCGIEAFRSMDSLHKITGVGPDCFADYVYDVPELAEKLADRFTNLRLTNAHNEQLTLLVNVGIFGWLCYAGIFATAFVRYVRKASEQPVLYVCALGILAYTVHNMVSFQQVLNTPYAFILLGIGEKVYRDMKPAKERRQSCD